MANTRDQLAFATVRTLYGITIVSFVAIGQFLNSRSLYHASHHSQGIQLFVCSYGLSLFLETPKHIRKGRIPYIVVSWVIFVLFCLAQTGDAYQMFEILYHGAADDPMDVLRLRHEDDHVWWRLSSTFCIYVVNWIADGLLVSYFEASQEERKLTGRQRVYRCYIIWTEKRWVCILPFLAYLSSMAMAIVTFVSIRSSTSILARINTKALSSWIYLSVGVNFLVTGLITFRLLRLRRQMAQFMPMSELRVYLGVVAILHQKNDKFACRRLFA